MQQVRIFAKTERNIYLATKWCQDAFNAWVAEQPDLFVANVLPSLVSQADWCDFALTVLYGAPDQSMPKPVDEDDSEARLEHILGMGEEERDRFYAREAGR